MTLAGGTLDLGGMTLTNAVNVTGALTGGLTNGTLQTVFSPAGENSIGTQNYALSVRPSGTLRGSYLLDVAQDGVSDLLAVQGDIDLSKIDLEILDIFSLDVRIPYTILTCSGTLTGKFNAANLPESRWSLIYKSNGTVKLAFANGTVFILK